MPKIDSSGCFGIYQASGFAFKETIILGKVSLRERFGSQLKTYFGLKGA